MAEVYPPFAFLFLLEFSDKTGNMDASFQEVSGINSEIGFEEIGEGGENRFKHQLPLPARHTNLILKRGLLLSGSTLALWCKETLESDFNSPIKMKHISVSLIDKQKQKIITWFFVDAWPIKWNISSLNSMENMIVTETLEFSYKYLTRKYIDPPVSLSGQLLNS